VNKLPEIDGVNLPFLPIGGVDVLQKQSQNVATTSNKSSFSELLEQEINNVKFSAHAKTRLASRDLSISVEDMEKLETAVDKAQQKGSTDSLVIMNEKAFIVNVPNRTVVTVVNPQNMNDNIITNIDSAVFV
jgi:flagellar operon protein